MDDTEGSVSGDYEPCAGCGFDHEYEPREAQQAHTEELIQRFHRRPIGVEEGEIHDILAAEGVPEDMIFLAAMAARIHDRPIGDK